MKGVLLSMNSSRAATTAALQLPPLIRRLALDEFVARRNDRCAAVAAVDHEHLVAVDQLLDRRARLGGIAGAVLVNDLDLAAVDAALVVDVLVERDRAVVDRVAVDTGGAGQRAEHADLDRRVRHAVFRDRWRCRADAEREDACCNQSGGNLPVSGSRRAHGVPRCGQTLRMYCAVLA